MIPTVKISDGAGGFYIINADDYDPSVHQLLSEVADDRATLQRLSVPELRSLASTLKISGRSKMNESELITAILEAGYDPNQLSD